jgi:hypothetical protein
VLMPDRARGQTGSRYRGPSNAEMERDQIEQIGQDQGSSCGAVEIFGAWKRFWSFEDDRTTRNMLRSGLRRRIRGGNGPGWGIGDSAFCATKPNFVLLDLPMPAAVCHVCQTLEYLAAVAAPQELKLVKYFSQNPQRVLSRDPLRSDAWEHISHRSTRNVNTHVLNRRRKLEKNPANPVQFLRVHNAGCKFVP